MGRKVKIVFATSNSSEAEFLYEVQNEVKSIRDKVLNDTWRKNVIKFIERNGFELETLATEFNQDLEYELILHYSGHSNSDGVSIIGEDGNEILTKESLAALIKAHKDRVRLVFLNSCFISNTLHLILNFI